MIISFRTLVVWCLFVVLFSGCGPSVAPQHYRIGFSQCGDADQWRKAMLAEMQRELSFHPGMELIYKQADNNSNRQITQVKELLAAKIDLLIISPNEASPLTPVVEEVYDQGIPVIVVDRKIASGKYTNYIGADNYQVGKMAGDYVAALLKGKGKIMAVEGLPASSPAIERKRGFREALAQHPGIQLLAELHGDWLKARAEHALDGMQRLLPETDLIFAHNDVMALGAREACDKAGLSGVMIVGVDALPGKDAGLEMVNNGQLKASLLYPTGGKEAIRNAAAILTHQQPEKETYLQTMVVDSSNARMMTLQSDKITSQQHDIELQQRMLEEQKRTYNSQRTIVYVLGVTLALALFFAGLLWYSRNLNQQINRKLAQQNEEISRQSLQLVEMSEAAAKANEARINFFTNISHEIRTPLTLILGPLDEILQSTNMRQGDRQQLLMVRRNANRLLHLVNQLMDFRKLEFNRMQVKATETDLVAFCRNITAIFQPIAAKRGIDCRLVTQELYLPAWIDEGMMDKVLFNLLSNALKFTPDHGSVIVKLGKNEGQAFIEVQDTGIGMPAEVLQHVFDVFYQGDVDNHKGSGLGLALCKELVQLHHGTIGASSEKNRGATFTVMLPLGNSHFTPAELFTSKAVVEKELPFYTGDLLPVQESAAPAPVADKKGVLLLVEDNPEMRAFLKGGLEHTYELLEAENGEKGMALALEYLPDGIISDVNMPVKNGHTLLKELKADVRTAHIPVILLTARNTPEQQVEGLQHQADAYMTKPFDFTILRNTLTSLLQNRSSLKAHFTAEVPATLRTAASRKTELRFVSAFTAIVEQNIGNEQFAVEDIYRQMNISKVQLYRKVKALMNVNINEYILNTRLQKAKYYLQYEDVSVSEVAYRTGFSSPAYFSTVFKGKFGVSPTAFKGKK